MAKRILNVKVLPGEPLDGSGKICIHLFVPDSHGPFTEPSVLCVEETDEGKKLSSRATRGRLACDPRRKVATVTVRGVSAVTPRTDDPRAVTCPKCITSDSYSITVDRINELTQQTVPSRTVR